MKAKKLSAVMKGLSAVMAVLLVLSMVGTQIAETYRTYLNDFLGIESYVTSTEEGGRFVSDYDTVEDLAAAAREVAIREGEEGTVVMKNENGVLPLASGKQVALFGLAAYAPYPYSSGDLKAGNADAADLAKALTDAGVTVNEKLKDFYLNQMMNLHEEELENRWTGEKYKAMVYEVIYNTSVGDMGDYQINEPSPAHFAQFGIDSNWHSWIDKDNTVGICVFARPAGEGNTYAPGTAVNFDGEKTGKDPLQLSDDELAVVDAAKETCSQVVVLLNTGNTLMIGDIAKGGAHEVDGICYIGCPNDYQCIGIANVLTGKVNATGALTDTFPVSHTSIPAVQNFGGQAYADADVVASNGTDPRYPGVDIVNGSTSSFGGGSASYSGNNFIVEAEGIYIGYKYYETRYFDSIMNPQFNASSASGATQAASWDYNKEVLYSFGHGLSYLDYTQTIKSVNVDKTPEGNITAVVTVTNKSGTDGKFLAQLYVQQPYTQYDMTNKVEKSAVMFLNSAKVDVPAGQSVDVTITVPTKYLASYDSNAAKTYILDEGDYYFTAAAGSHAATNNFLAAQGKTAADGVDTDNTGACVTWNCAEFDDVTYSVSNGVKVTNVADNADLNYWTGEETVTYMTRQNWDTFPINYNTDVTINISDSPRAEEWIAELRGQQYTVQTNSPAAEGVDKGLRFNSTDIQAEQLTNINDPFWNDLVSEITIDEAVGAVIHGGSRSDTLSNIDNPVVIQNEGVNGFTAKYNDEATGKSYGFNINSMTLLGSSFNPDLAYEWGLVEGNSGLWLDRYDLWGIGLTQRRTPYNGRNYEYVSEDAMLGNRIGYGVLKGCTEKGILNGPKHIGCNDQEHNRGGIAAYMTEQKLRETDLRCFQGALEDAHGLAVMVAFNRIGATNAAHHVGMLQKILRGEWNFTGVISTDMMNNSYYFNPESMVMSGITQVADFAGDNSHINLGEGGVDAVWPYISVDSVKNDSALVEQARENLKYQLYTFANSAIMNISTEVAVTWWDNALAAVTNVSLVLMVVTGAAWLVLTVLPEKKKEEV